MMQLGTQVIDTALQDITKKEFSNATASRGEHISVWSSTSRIMSRQDQLKFCWILIRSRRISKPPEGLLYLP